MISEHDIEAFKRFQPAEDLMDDYVPDYYGKVRDFRKAYKRPIGLTLTKKNIEAFWFAHKLINEEFRELSLAMTNSDRYLVENQKIPDDIRENLLQEMCDLLYVVFDMAATFDLPIGEAFNRVHRSNMSKLGEDGKPIYREDGKVLKGPNYKKPNLKGLI